MDDKERTPEEWEDEFEAIVEDEDQNPIKFHVEVTPIDPEDDVELPKYRTAQEAFEAWKKEREERKKRDND